MLSKQDQSRELQKRQEKERQEAQNRQMDHLAQVSKTNCMPQMTTDILTSPFSKSSTTGTPPFKRTVGEPRSALSVRTADNTL